MSEISYVQLKEQQQKEIDAFPIQFAFSRKQFDEGMVALGLKPENKHLVCSLGSSGGFIRKTDMPAFGDMMLKHLEEMNSAIASDATGLGFIQGMFRYELDNHEYCVTRDLTDTLSALELDMDDIKKNPALSKGLQKALSHYYGKSSPII